MADSNVASRFLKLPELEFDYDALQPYMSEQQLRLHHEKHHAAYVNGTNAILESLDKARKQGADIDAKAVAKAFSFNMGGHVMHSWFWKNLSPAGECSPEPVGGLAEAMKSEFGSFQRFKKEFAQAAASVEGSGWAMLTFCPCTHRPVILQLEKHNVNLVPGSRPLLVLDVWEHAYYLDYKNDRAKFIEAFWNVADWDEASERFDDMVGTAKQ
jgi:Fe-Mn family superoxide dismutase